MSLKNIGRTGQTGLCRFEIGCLGLLQLPLSVLVPAEFSGQVISEIIGYNLPFAANLLGGKLAGLYKSVCGGLPYVQDRADVFQ